MNVTLRKSECSHLTITNISIQIINKTKYLGIYLGKSFTYKNKMKQFLCTPTFSLPTTVLCSQLEKIQFYYIPKTIITGPFGLTVSKFCVKPIPLIYEIYRSIQAISILYVLKATNYSNHRNNKKFHFKLHSNQNPLIACMSSITTPTLLQSTKMAQAEIAT